MSEMQWIKSSHSDHQGGNCVEWAPGHASAGSIPVRDSKDTRRAHLHFSPSTWTAFVTDVQEHAR
ncbi:DUF397 domain-containing protein [Streptomyces sulphureus]|uniref:DUF397 domain-containing protein n=1 Tax=Streptomyces sulphureus TaxID=47758 RepID=UPI000997B3AC|nr:DUF397 domain-containing protein [Streptomyces sulphureus]